jgi:hypothetical protein
VEEDTALPSKLEARVKEIQADYTVKMSEILIASIVKGHVPSVAECMRRRTDPNSVSHFWRQTIILAWCLRNIFLVPRDANWTVDPIPLKWVFWLQKWMVSVPFSPKIHILNPHPPHIQLNQKGNSALFIAAHTGHVGIIQLLLEGGASPDFQCPEESITPLIEAASNNQHQAVSALLEGNAK